jgi:hypothetical protein
MYFCERCGSTGIDYKIKQGHILFIDEISKIKRIFQKYEITEFLEYEGIKE